MEEALSRCIDSVLEDESVDALYIYGSYVNGYYREDSDIDFLYELDRSAIADGQYLPHLDGLIAGLLDIFSGRKLDLVHYPSLRNPYFVEEVDETKVLLYDQNPEEVSV